MRLLLPIILVALASCEPAYAGYSIFQRQQITPELAPVHGPNGVELRKNLGTLPQYPATYGRKVCEAKDLYSSNPGSQVEVWEDTAGTATTGQLLAACPQIRDIKGAEVRAEGNRRMSAMAAPYLERERESWFVQVMEAERYFSDPVNYTPPMLTDQAAWRGVTVAALAGEVMDATTLLKHATAAILGQQQHLLDWINQEPDFATLAGIKWE